MTTMLCDLDDDGICRRCQRRVKIFPGRKTIAQCPEPPTPEEIARRKAICLACEDWTDGCETKCSTCSPRRRAPGCRLIPEFEREKLTAYKQEHGHCLRGCHDGKRKW
jgi:hypothetical protein